MDFFLDSLLTIHFASYHVAAKHSPGTVHGFEQEFFLLPRRSFSGGAAYLEARHDSFREDCAWLQALCRDSTGNTPAY